MRSFLQSNDEVALGVRNAHKEHKASMDKMIMEVSQLADSIREMKGNLGRLPLKERVLDRANVGEITLRSETSCKEPESEISPERLGELRNAEDAPIEKSSPDEIKLIAAPQSDNAPREDLREVTGEPDQGMKREEPCAHRSDKKRKKEGAIDCVSTLGKFEVTLLCLQAATQPLFSKSVKEDTVGRARGKEKVVIKGSVPAMVHRELSYKRSDPRWCNMTSSETRADHNVEETTKEVLTVITIRKRE